MRIQKAKQGAYMVLLVGSMLASLTGCTMDSTIAFDRPAEPFESTTSKMATLSMHQGGTVNAATGSGYKVNVSLGVQLNRERAVTAGGYKVEMNFPGQNPN